MLGLVKIIRGFVVFVFVLFCFCESLCVHAEEMPIGGEGDRAHGGQCSTGMRVDADDIDYKCTESVNESYGELSEMIPSFWLDYHIDCLENSIQLTAQRFTLPDKSAAVSEILHRYEKDLYEIFSNVYSGPWNCGCGSGMAISKSRAVDKLILVVLKSLARAVNTCASVPVQPRVEEEPARGRDVGQPDNASEP
ncbi:MAG: hypothetical protein HQL66_04180 [Magnetococcales bacterium]|nr:hypothetical protein [Magnetococcales bacterium]